MIKARISTRAFFALARGQRSGRPNRQGGLRQNLLLNGFAERERPKFVEILLDVGYARPRPVRAEERFVRDLFKAREVFQQRLGRDAADVEIYVWMPPHEEECGLHPQRTPTVRQQDLQLREIDSHIVNVDG